MVQVMAIVDRSHYAGSRLVPHVIPQARQSLYDAITSGRT